MLFLILFLVVMPTHYAQVEWNVPASVPISDARATYSVYRMAGKCPAPFNGSTFAAVAVFDGSQNVNTGNGSDSDYLWEDINVRAGQTYCYYVTASLNGTVYAPTSYHATSSCAVVSGGMECRIIPLTPWSVKAKGT